MNTIRKTESEHNNFDHLTTYEVEQMYLMGLGDKFEISNKKHLDSCLNCRYMFINTRDKVLFDNEIYDHIIESPRKMSLIKNDLTNFITKKYGCKTADEHPILKYVSDDSYVKRITSIDTKLKASLITSIIAETLDEGGEIFYKTGEFNFQVFSQLEKKYNIDQFIQQGNRDLFLHFLGGPKISTELDKTELNSVNIFNTNYAIKLAKQYPEKVKINLKKRNREKYHYMVHSSSNTIAFCDDLHQQYGERGTTIVYNDSELCNYLREDFKRTLQDPDVENFDLDFESIKSRLE